MLPQELEQICRLNPRKNQQQINLAPQKNETTKKKHEEEPTSDFHPCPATTKVHRINKQAEPATDKCASSSALKNTPAFCGEVSVQMSERSRPEIHSDSSGRQCFMENGI